jgi:general stress protein CsbA
MTSKAITPRGATRAELSALAGSCRATSDEWLATVGHLQRRSHGAATIAAIGLLGLCAGVVLVALWFLRWSMLWPVIATMDSMALVVGGVWLNRITKRSRADIAAARRAAQHARGEARLLADGLAACTIDETPENILSKAIATVDSIALTAGGIWLDKLGRRSIAAIAARRRTAKPVLAR